MNSPTPSGEVTIDGPITKEQAGAQEAFREHAFKTLPRYFEVEAALKEQPKNPELRREFKNWRNISNLSRKTPRGRLDHRFHGTGPMSGIHAVNEAL